MNLALFGTLIEVAKLGSVSKASKKLYLTQPAVTKQIQALEEIYEKKLFVRATSGLRLTEEGRTLLVYAREMLKLLDKSFVSVKEEGESLSGRLKIATNLTLGIHILPKIIRFFSAVYPRIKIEAFLNNNETITRSVKKGDAHFGFIGKDPGDPLITLHDFFQDQLVVVIAPGFGIKNPTSWKKLLKIPFIGRERGSDIRSTYEEWFKERETKVIPAIELNNTEAIISSVACRLGFSILPLCTVKNALRQGVVSTVSVPYFNPLQNFYICHKTNRSFSKVEKIFLESVFNRFTQGSPRFPETIDQYFYLDKTSPGATKDVSILEEAGIERDQASGTPKLKG
jgi:LysR family transcriptional regulator, transcriptional activator of the cysJI operon